MVTCSFRAVSGEGALSASFCPGIESGSIASQGRPLVTTNSTTAATKLNHIAFVREICRRGASPMTVAFVARMPAAT